MYVHTELYIFISTEPPQRNKRVAQATYACGIEEICYTSCFRNTRISDSGGARRCERVTKENILQSLAQTANVEVWHWTDVL